MVMVRVATSFVITLLLFGCLGEQFGPSDWHLTPDELPRYLHTTLCAGYFPRFPNEPIYDCSPNPFLSESECNSLVGPHFERGVDAAVAAGLTFDEACALTGTTFGCHVDCQMFFGTGTIGDPCEAFGRQMSDCEQGLVCGVDRRCHVPCDEPQIALEGDYCGPSRGVWEGSCAAGFACGNSGTCETAAGLGAPCDAATLCAVGSWCADSICVAQVMGGEACDTHESCLSRLCSDGACIEPESPECGRWAW